MRKETVHTASVYSVIIIIVCFLICPFNPYVYVHQSGQKPKLRLLHAPHVYAVIRNQIFK